MSHTARRLPTPEISSSENPSSYEARTRAVLDRTFSAIAALIPDGDLFIGQCVSLARTCEIEWSTGVFAPLTTLNIFDGPLTAALKAPWSEVAAADFACCHPRLNTIGQGTAIVFRVDGGTSGGGASGGGASGGASGGGDGGSRDGNAECIAVVGVWQPKSRGPIPRERIEAIHSVIALTTIALATPELSLDVEAQAMQLESLHNEVAEIQTFYRRISDAIRQAFWVYDIDRNRVLMTSDNFERVWGASPRILSEGFEGFMANVSPLDRDRVLAELHMSHSLELNTELRVMNAAGEEAWVWLRAFPLDDGGGAGAVTRLGAGGASASAGAGGAGASASAGAGASASAGLGAGAAAGTLRALSRKIVFIADEVTDKKIQEELTRDREVSLASHAKMLAVGHLASGVAHEINNPLAIIVGKASEITRLVDKNQADPAALVTIAEKIKTTSIRISQIVGSLKAVSSADREPMAVTRLAKLVNDIRDLSSERFKARGVTLEILPVREALDAELNPTLMSQTLLNLLNNALDAVENEKEKWVRLELTDDDESVFIYVTDSGPGIPIKNRSRIFDPFFTTKEPSKGTGLGLSLAASFAAHHQGLIRLDTYHSHTRFVVQIPKRQAK